MAAPQPLLSAGLPGLAFGLSHCRGLSMQLDSSGHVIGNQNVMNPEEDECYTKNVTLPTGMIVVHFYGLHDLIIPDMTEGIIYTTFTIGAITKVSSQQEYNVRTTAHIFNEIKMISLVVNPKPKQNMNKFIIHVYACNPGEEHAVSKSKHRLVGRYETHLHKLLKNFTMKDDGILLNRKGNVSGTVEFECCVSYGSFGYGQSYQIKNNIHSPAELVKMSLLPRIPPVESDPNSRGTDIHPRKLKHPGFIPLQNDPVEDLEPEISAYFGETALECPDFPLLRQHMQRINQIQTVFSKQPTRQKRVCFLRKMLQDGGAVLADEIEEVSDDEVKEVPVPPVLTLPTNTTGLLTHVPGLIRRRLNSARPFLPSCFTAEEAVQANSR